MEVVYERLLHRHVSVPQDWLRECVQAIRNERQNNVDPVQLTKLVYVSWLYADLRRLPVNALPALSGPKTYLQGSYCVQINWLMDVGCSQYSQLQKLNKFENENVDVDTDRDEQPKWEPKPKRMLWMEVTDGAATLKAMEYKPISSLSTLTLPGTKILLHGTVECRNKVLLLTNENVQPLGGKVEELNEYRLPQMLAQMLGKTVTRERTAPVPPPQGMAPSQQPTMSRVLAPLQQSQLPREQQTTGFTTGIQQTQTAAQHHDASVVAGHQRQTQQQQQQSFVMPVQQQPLQISQRQQIPRTPLRTDFMTQQTQMHQHPSLAPRSFQTPFVSTQQARARVAPQPFVVPESSQRQQRDVFEYSQTPIGPLTHTAFRDDFVMTQGPLYAQERRGMHSNTMAMDVDLFDRPPFVDRPVVSPVPFPTLQHNNSFMPHQQVIEPVPWPADVLSDNDGDFSPQSLTNFDFMGRQPSSPLIQLNDFHFPVFDGNLEEDFEMEQSPVGSDFTFLSDVRSSMALAVSTQNRTIKGIVMTTMQRLHNNDGRFWSLVLKINDGSDSMDCRVDDTWLCDTLGMTAAEAQSIRRRREPRQVAQGMAAVAELQHFLQRMDLLFDIDFDINPNSVPLIRNIRTVQ